MYDIQFLEEEWAKYKRKKRRPLYFLLIVSVLIVSAFFVLEYKNISVLSMITKPDVTKRVIKTSDVLVDRSLDTLQVKSETKSVVTQTVSNDNPMDPSDVFVDDEPVKVERERSRKKIHFTMIDADTPAVAAEVKDRFKFAPSTDDSLFLARYYYNNGNYNKAAYWALQTNKINGEIEESWLIFARAKTKSGKKNEAIRILSQYVQKSKSVEAQKLLIKLKK